MFVVAAVGGRSARMLLVLVVLGLILGVLWPAGALAAGHGGDNGDNGDVEGAELDLPPSIGPAPEGVARFYRFHEDVAFLILKPVVAPLYSGDRAVHRVFYGIAVAVRDAKTAAKLKKRLRRFGDLALEVLNAGSYAMERAPHRIKMRRLKSDLLKAMQGRFGAEEIIRVMIYSAVPSP